MIKNIVVLLFVFIIGLGVGLYYGWLEGREKVNNQLIVSVWSEAYAQGRIDGGAETIYSIFYDYLKTNPYKLDQWGDK